MAVDEAWRQRHPFDQLKALLARAGVTGRIVGRTPVLKHHGVFRGEEIQTWLDCQIEPVERGAPAENVYLLVHGKAHRLGKGEYGSDTILEVIADHVTRYAVRLVRGTHPRSEVAPNQVNQFVKYGSSPRGVQATLLAAKIKALFEGRLILKEAADFLGIGRRHVHQLIEEGCLADDPVHKGIVRARRVFLQRDLDALVERATNGLSTVTKADIAAGGAVPEGALGPTLPPPA